MTETETHQTDVCDHLGLLKLSADKTMASLFWPTLYTTTTTTTRRLLFLLSRIGLWPDYGTLLRVLRVLYEDLWHGI